MFKRYRLLAFLLVPTLFGLASTRIDASERERGRADREITVMTRNLYFGADLTPAILAILSGIPENVPPAVSEVWANVQATDFPVRAQALAAEIADAKPDLVGLQEAALWRSEDPADFDGPNATHVEYDFLRILLDDLAARGEHYALVASSAGFDVEAPRLVTIDPLTFEDIRLTDHVAVLARTGQGPKVQIIRTFTGSFVTNVAFDGVTVLYGWAGADVRFRGREFRFVTTHLESDFDEVRNAQAAELLAGPLDTALPVILTGDTNSNANGDSTSTAYFEFLGAGFTDAFGTAHPGVVIDTCCHDALLSNPTPFTDPFGRIDHVLFRGGFEVEGAGTVGADPADRIQGLWPSDHAGVVVRLEIR